MLSLLLARHGHLVSRTEIFDAVWTNQAVSDDTLTRAMSDIRTELKRLTGRDGHIETIPKRGYRWPASVETVTAPTASPHGELATVDEPGKKPHLLLKTRLLRYAAIGIGYLLGFLLLVSVGTWLLDRLSGRSDPVVAVLPTGSESSDVELAMAVEDRLYESLLELDEVALLSRAVVDSRQASPFPYFFFEFDARWVIESEIRAMPEGRYLGLSLVDARTGIVLFETGEYLASPASDDQIAKTALGELLEALTGTPAAP